MELAAICTCTQGSSHRPSLDGSRRASPIPGKMADIAPWEHALATGDTGSDVPQGLNYR